MSGSADNTNEPSTSQDAQHQAATVLQSAWRRRAVRRGELNADGRWQDAMIHARFNSERNDAMDGKNDARHRWRRGLFLTGRLVDGEGIPGDSPSPAGNLRPEADPALLKTLEAQHWLELTDAKHRYGANLKWYHKVWREDQETTDNFFKWLDHGPGKDLSLPQCSREQLDKERITYLTAEQRLNYLVKIDEDGKLRWERTNEYVDTMAGKWEDAGEGRGIIAKNGPDLPPPPRRRSLSSSGIDSTDSSGEEQEAAHYQGTDTEVQRGPIKEFKSHFTTSGLMERLLRKTIRKNTWMYVADKHFNVFVGIKNSGAFQHSSFLNGGLVASAGLIVVKNGLITSLSPLSGHYRTSSQHFKAFIRAMDERGADMHKIRLTKGEAMLWGLEHYGKFKKEKHTFVIRQKERFADAAKSMKKALPSAKRKTSSGISEAIDEGEVNFELYETGAAPAGNQSPEMVEESTQWKRDILVGRGRKAREEQVVKWEATMRQQTDDGNEPKR